LALRDLERLIAPGAFVATAEFDPRAEAVRRWAYNASVEAIVVGRVSTPRSAAEGSMRVEAVVRSGHSGAELARHDLVVPAGAGLGPSMEKLAVAILGDLGQVDAPRLDRPGPPEVGARPATGDAGGPASEGRGLDADLEFSGFQDDAPIQIEAEEAEIISRDADRLLVFQRNVRVRQANIRLRSDRLEAVYERGESEPRKLVAQGAVRIDQDGRRASCDRAVYVRADQRLSCHGHAELVQGCDIVRGESIEFDLAGDRARVEGAASIVIQPGEDAATSCNATRGTL
ncbi:MAG: hypothetical protein CL908_07790, partial [Deltaproteobacteria bacterium]|nr:hypothetical protein [Deltaproteobacteria bacterium]